MKLELTPEQEQAIHDEFGEPADLLGTESPHFNIPGQVLISLEDRATLHVTKVESDEAVVMKHMIECLLNEGITVSEMQTALQIARNIDEAKMHIDALASAEGDDA